MAKKIHDTEPQIVVPKKVCSCRLNITLMSSLAFFCANFMTMNLGMVIVCMEDNRLSVSNNSDTNCTTSTSNGVKSTGECSYQETDIHWEKDTQSYLLGAAYFGSVPAQILVGWLSDKFGKNKLQMILGSGVMGLLSILSPLFIEHTEVPYYFTVRVILGAASCFAMSSILPMLNCWSTSREQGFMLGFAFAGAALSRALTYPISGFLCEFSGWKSIFYSTGACGVLWSLAAIFLIYDTPMSHPRIGAEEKQYLLSSKMESENKKKKKVVIPWKNILLSVPVWSVIITNFFFFAVVGGFIAYLPLFLKEVLDLSVTENGIFAALPSVVAFITRLVVGPLFDYVRSKNVRSVTAVRKIFHMAGTIVPAVFMVVAGQLDASYKYVIIVLITIGYALNEVACIGGYMFSFLDMAPDYVGILQGINFTIGASAGFIVPVVISALIPGGTQEEWSYVYIMFGCCYVVAGLVWLLTGSSSLQAWGKAKETREHLDTVN